MVAIGPKGSSLRFFRRGRMIVDAPTAHEAEATVLALRRTRYKGWDVWVEEIVELEGQGQLC